MGTFQCNTLVQVFSFGISYKRSQSLWKFWNLEFLNSWIFASKVPRPRLLLMKVWSYTLSSELYFSWDICYGLHVFHLKTFDSSYRYYILPRNLSWVHVHHYFFPNNASSIVDLSSWILIKIRRTLWDDQSCTLCKMCPNTEFFLVSIFPYSDWIRRFAEEISVFSPNMGKYGPEKTLYLHTFHAVAVCDFLKNWLWFFSNILYHNSFQKWALKRNIAQIGKRRWAFQFFKFRCTF